MRRILSATCALLFASSSAVFAQEEESRRVEKREVASYDSAGERALFPRNFVRGFVDFSVAPYHNEPDLGRCGGPFYKHGGSNARCTAFARYVWSGYVELQPLGRSPLRHVFVFIEPKIFLGENVPQFRYTTSSAPMAYERSVGVGLELPKDFEVRVTQHQVRWLGRYSRNLGTADLGTDGPYGLFATVGVRWYFGGYNRARAVR